MKFYVLTLFPELVRQGLSDSILGRAIKEGKVELQVTNIRDFSKNKHGQVDDTPYGGGAGMILQAPPIFDAYQSLLQTGASAHTPVIFPSPHGIPFRQKMAEDFAKEKELIFLCGHYEGVDERIVEEIVTDAVSLGDYILTGGELATMVMIDCIARLIPGVLHNPSSIQEESFSSGLLEYPQYTRPVTFHGKRVPDVLLSGHHEKIAQWRMEQSLKRTKQWRPDLLQQIERKGE